MKVNGVRRTALVLMVALAFDGCSYPSNAPAATGLALNPNVWWRNGVCYEVFVRSFYDSDGDGVGDLRGLTSRLDYINDGNPNSGKSLGANCIWLMPIDKSMSYHGYDVVDYYHVDPRYGTDDDFRNLVTEAHRRGIHVIVDFVPNHSGSQNPWFQAALNDPKSPYRDWYRWSKTLPTQKGPWGQQAWHKSPVRDEYYYGLFWSGMPDLNFEHPAVMNEAKYVAKYWLDSLGVAATVLVYAWYFRQLAIRDDDPDVWGRLAMGRQLVEAGRIVHEPTFAYTPTWPTMSEIFRTAMRPLLGRSIVFGVWLWIGWHLFVRGWSFFLRS